MARDMGHLLTKRGELVILDNVSPFLTWYLNGVRSEVAEASPLLQYIHHNGGDFAIRKQNLYIYPVNLTLILCVV